MERLRVLPDLLDASIAKALVPRLSETEPLYSEFCAAMIARLSGAYGGQGEELEYAKCQYQGGTSNGALAGKLLEGWAFAHPEVLSEIAEYVRRNPSATEGVIDSLGPLAPAPAPSALKALSNASEAGSQLALLRLAVVGRCGSVSDRASLEPVVMLLQSHDAKVKSYAALVLLRLGACDKTVEGLQSEQQTATSLVETRLEDPGDKSIVDEVAWLGPAGAVFVPKLSRRFEVKPADERALIVALGEIGPGASALVPQLVKILDDPKRLHLHADTLRALTRIGPPASSAKAAILKCLTREPLLSDGFFALSGISARLSRNEFSRLNALYRADCKEAGSIPFFSLERDEDCGKQASVLAALAEVGGFSFQEVGWRR
jgi:hypothetical protein